MYRIVVHVGLPKTATTSLQINVLMPLHREERINYLGRYKTVFDDDYFNPFGTILRLLEDAESHEEYVAVRERLESILVEDRVNVISEESLTYSSKQKKTIPKLSRLLHPYRTQVLVSLREPTSFLHSYYVELYRWKYHSDPEVNTLEKYVSRLMDDQASGEFDIFFFHRFVSFLTRNFPDFQILLFEDMEYDPESYFGPLAHLLDVDAKTVRSLFFASVQNTRATDESGKRSESVTLDQKIASMATRAPRLGRRTLKSMKPIRAVYANVLKMTRFIPLAPMHKHRHFTPEQREALRPILCIGNDMLCDIVEEKKLAEYGYLWFKE